jgi:hypothetical protein
MNNCPILLHEHNEYIPREAYIKGIGIYVELIKVMLGLQSITAVTHCCHSLSPHINSRLHSRYCSHYSPCRPLSSRTNNRLHPPVDDPQGLAGAQKFSGEDCAFVVGGNAMCTPCVE